MNQADTAWMLISTALVLLMTPALAFFYGGLVRSKNALNTMMMSFISLGFVGVLWAVVGYSLSFAPGNDWIGDLSRLCLRGVGLEAQGTIPHYLFMAYQGTFCIITAALISGAIVERMRFSAYLAFISLWAVVVYARWRTGSGAAAGWPRWARSTSPAAPSCTSTPASPRWWRRWWSASGSDYELVAAAAQRAVHAARRRPAVVRLVRVQRRQRAGRQPVGGARLHDHDAGAGGHAGRLDAARLHAHGQADRGRRRHRHRGRAGRGHPGGRLRRADERHCARRDRRGSQLLRSALAREDVARRFARRRGRARPRRHGGRAADRRVRAEGAERRRRRPAVRQPGQLGIQAMAVVAAIVYSGVDELRAAQADRPGHAAARRRRRTRASAWTSASTAKRRTCMARTWPCHRPPQPRRLRRWHCAPSSPDTDFYRRCRL